MAATNSALENCQREHLNRVHSYIANSRTFPGQLLLQRAIIPRTQNRSIHTYIPFQNTPTNRKQWSSQKHPHPNTPSELNTLQRLSRFTKPIRPPSPTPQWPQGNSCPLSGAGA
ncbi:hypothetical protein I7I53_07089 [Histoplasma capsulatum var. duboisii H88]|uniref:Uncharacterized protein n=1 Tax=Ajellomyces capsulatus (strain H88) TaxID=544711 RepID=A0A8A1LCQ7_AJEC8|nr:hypothetical protein I7I53_07089 [Histoplasma capsulatum var. duboisii H88]